jgi:Acetoacetate decarboxylase (ADC)
MASPTHVRRGGLDVSPPPWQCDDLEGTVFLVEGNRAALQAVCDRTLNAPSGGRLDYRPVVSWVALTFQAFRGMRSISPASPLGESHTYKEAAFWIIVKDSRGPHDRAELMIPYMFIDDWVALAAGREIYGYPKEHASLTIPPIASPPLRFAVEALAVPTRGAAASPAMIVECVARNPLLAAEWALLENVWPQIEVLAGIGGALERMWDLIKMLIAQRLDFVFLRQLRALGGGPGTDLQQVTAASANPFITRDMRILADYELHLPPFASHPIAADLGLSPGGIVDAPLGFQCRAHFTLQPGAVI